MIKEVKYNYAGFPIDTTLKDKKYIISSRKFEGVPAAACPLVGQIATNNKFLALLIYKYLSKFSMKHYCSIAVQLIEKKKDGYEIIKR